ncbi:ribosomal-protein-alanine N-acetyltransferase [compost metagenome]
MLDMTWDDVLKLQQCCEKADEIALKLNWDMLEEHSIDDGIHLYEVKDEKMVAFLGRYLFGGKLEVCGMVHPDYRRQGIFTKLLSKGLDETPLAETSEILLNAPANSKSAKLFLDTISCKYEMSEYQMKYHSETDQLTAVKWDVTLRQATEQDTELLIRLDSDGFGMTYEESKEFYDDMSLTQLCENEVILLDGEPAGKIRVTRIHGESWIYGFVVSGSYRGQRIGSSVLRKVIDRELAAGFEHIGLEVALTNPDAMKLYTTAGFQVVSSQDYYKYISRNV